MKNHRKVESFFVLFFVLFFVVTGLTPKAGAQETFNLKYSGFMPKEHIIEAVQQWWGQEVEKRTNGRVKVSYYHAQTLGKLFDFPKMLKGGLCDIAQIPNTPQFPILNLFDAPFLIVNRAEMMDVFWALYYKDLIKGLDDYKVLFWLPIDATYMFFRNRKVTSMEDFKGLKIRGMPGFRTAIGEALGATGVAMPSTETYMALDRGILDGVNTTIEFATSVKLNEVTKYLIMEPICTGGMVVAMNLELWNRLPVDIQAIMKDLNAQARYRFMDLWTTPAEDRELAIKKGWDVYDISPEERAKWKKAGEQIIEKWVEEQEAKGVPARRAVNEIKKVVALYE